MNNITLLSEGDFIALLIIADKQFGNGYLSKSELQSYIDDKNKTGFVSRTNNTITGFQLILTCNFDEIMSLVLCEQEWFKEQFSNTLSIGVIKTIAVSDEFKNKGIGTALTMKSVEMLRKSSSSMLSICWDQKEDTTFSRVLEKCGMKLTHRIAEYWREDSLKRNYKCKSCGSPPCTCNASIFQYLISKDSK